jgi:hypothetical protein
MIHVVTTVVSVRCVLVQGDGALSGRRGGWGGGVSC